MAFENLSNRLSQTLKNIAGKGTLTNENMNDMLKEVRFALIEADVHPQVVNDFIEQIQQEATGQKVISALNPSEMVVKIVNEELINILGQEQVGLNYQEGQLTTMMMVGLQGSGKTTSSAKIARYITEKQDKKVLLVAADMQRLAAVEQLQILGQQVNVEVFSLDSGKPVEVATKALKYAKENEFDVMLVDTAGRLHVDNELMDELVSLEKLLNPNEILLTVDAMVGQDIVNVASSFKEQINLTGLMVTKYDGDARGGGILSVRHVTDVPVKFVGTGEKMDEIELFYPDRVASRILGMGDILTLIEQAQEKMDIEASEKSAERMMSGTFTFDDMLIQLEQVNKLGPLSGILKMLPGGANMMKNMNVSDDQSKAQMKKTKAMIQSMTLEERDNPNMIRASRRSRIAKGSGTSTTDVNRLLKQYEKMKDQMRLLSRMMK
ncbi:MAG: signal recognition particle protein [Erysipelothrix sp.]|nr:signal recognition particle protein [Erysipelothrix sp.]